MNILDEIQREVSKFREAHNRDISEIKSILTKLLSQDKYYSIQEFSDKLGIHYQTTRNAIKDGRVKANRFGNRRLMISSQELSRALQEVKSLKHKRDA